jgi:TRAP-type C4-dicarboxylate transport system substrate-binding protein
VPHSNEEITMSLTSFLRNIGATVGTALLATAPAVAQTNWDMPTPYPATNFHTENIQQFAADVAAATDGKLRITVHPGGSLFKANEIRRAVQTGQAQIGEVIISGMANEDPFFALDNVPFLATSYADAKALWDVSRSAVEERLAKAGLTMLFSVPWQPQGIYSTSQITGVSDLRGMKIRSYSPTVARMIELMGAQPVTVQAADLTQALATGMVSANLTSSATGYDSKSWEQLSWYADVRAWLPKNVVFVRTRDFNALDATTREALLKAAAEAETRGWALSEEKNDWYLEQLRAHGMNVVAPSPEFEAELRKIGETMTEEWLRSVGADGAKVLEAYRAARP